MREPSETPLVVLVIDKVEVKVTVGGTVVVAMVIVEVVTVVLEADGADLRIWLEKEAKGVEARPPEAVTMARARSIPAASPIPKRFPSITVCPPRVGR